MTQLFIDGQEAVLPIDFSCKIVNENPFFTKSGDYTLNITLSLENPVNAKIYKHINRINSLSRFENRTAIIVSDNKVIIKGEEVILKYSNNSIEIQILAGNSSLNYIIGNDLNLRDLDLGVAIINKNEIVANLSKDYPEVDYQLLPFYDRDLEFVGNKYSFIYDKTLSRIRTVYAYDGSFLNLAVEGNYKYENYRPQPYLCAIISKIFANIGYSLDNAIESHPIYKYAYIVHANDSLEFSKMLPGWTVLKFLEEIENLFDCTVVVDNSNMHASIILNYQFYSSSLENNIIMLDDFEAEVEDTDEKMQHEKNISYNLPDSPYYRYQNFDKILLDSLNVININTGSDKQNIDEITTTIKNKTPDSVRSSQRVLYKSNALQFIEYVTDNENTKKVNAKSVNDYSPVKNNSSDEYDVSFDIIPAEFHSSYFQIYLNMSNYYMQLHLPIAKCNEAPLIYEEKDGVITNPLIQDIIEGDKTGNKLGSGSNQISIAFYNSQYSTRFYEQEPGPMDDQRHPLSYIRSISESVKLTGSNYNFIYEYNGKYVNALSLKFLNEEIYSKGEKIDRKKLYKIQFVDNGEKLDPKDIYIIGNRKFYCRKIEKNITIDGFDEIIEGEFYAEKD